MTGTYNVITENMTIMEVAERIKKLTDCKIEVSKENIDKRDYKVSAEKINQFGFKPSKTLEIAFDEIKKAFDEGVIKDYEDPKYNNYKFLFGSKEMQEKVFIRGL